MNEHITILGAGLAGLIAGIDLVKHGYKVTIFEKAENIGGVGSFHPSIHVTPIDMEKTGKYIDIDVRPCFYPVKNFRAYFNKMQYHLDPQYLYAVERGEREYSIDTYLYKMATEAGVLFEFSHGVDDPGILPSGSIIATGLYPSMYDSLGLPKSRFYGVAPRFESKRDNELVAVFDDTIGDYYYHGAVNGLLFGHMFQRKKLTTGSIAECRDFLMKEENFPDTKWMETSLVMPGWSFRGPRLFCKGKILAGTISGMIDPLMGFGIVSAMYSGKIAAMAVYNPGIAKREFAFFTRNWHVSYILRALMDKTVLRTKLQEYLLVKAPESVRHVFLKKSRLTIPDVDIYPMMKPINPASDR